VRASGDHDVHGIQSWVALPDGHEDGEPTFVHHSASTLPSHTDAGIDLTIIAGEAFGLRSPVVTLWPTLYVHAQIAQGATLEIPAGHDERAVYVVQGKLGIGGTTLTEGQLAVLEPGTDVPLRALTPARAMLLGGEHFPTPRFIWWNFVASSEERIERAKERWERQQFPVVPGETEFIPLPHY
jgi:redox-sensitive bicupin YhaK (pirin superfamily)